MQSNEDRDKNVLNRFATGSDHRMVWAKIRINFKRDQENKFFTKSG